MAVARNRMIPLLGVIALAIVGTILWMQARGPAERPRAAPVLTQVPGALPAARGADHDTPTETLQTVVTSNRELRQDVQQVLEENRRLREEQRKNLRRGGPELEAGAAPLAPAQAPAPAPVAGDAEHGSSDVFDDAVARASQVAGNVLEAWPGGLPSGRPPERAVAADAHADMGERQVSPSAEGAVQYKVKPPMGYVLQATPGKGRVSLPITRYVRTSAPPSDAASAAADESVAGPAQRAAEAARHAQPTSTPYFTIPENATLAGVASMTSLIGRVPVDGRVTDPMQWKAVVGRDNLAANGFELPDDLAGLIVTGIAIGDMALSCSEGKVRSLTFVFNDGVIRTVSTRRGAFPENRLSGSGGNDDLGYVSDLHGNPCIAGRFVTNAPAYLTDIVGVKTLEVAGQAYAEAQRTVSQNAFGGATSTLTGSVGDHVMGQAVSGAADEVSRWLLARLKNSFDAVVTPAGQGLVLHLDQEIRIDRRSDARRLVHRPQPASASLARGAHHGLE